MKAVDQESWDERLVEQLVAMEDARAEGRPPNGDEVPEGLAGALSCLSLLEEVWPDASFAAGPRPRRDFFGRFELLEKLGEGGCGIVFRAVDPKLRRPVALKIPRPEAMLTPLLRQRFLREAKAAAGLDHPNLVPVYETGEEGLVCYIASVYCPGTNLKAYLEAHRASRQGGWELPVPAAVNLVATLADAIEYIHRRGVLHRDLKPSNVLLVPREVRYGAADEQALDTYTPRISDFGLAKLVADPDATHDVATRSGMIFGTPQYMAPEQAQGKVDQVGAAADIYALGVILFELLTGRLPFESDSELELLNKIVQEPPPRPSVLRPVIHRDLETICLQCLKKNPSERYATAAELSKDLNAYLKGEPIEARRAPWWERAVQWCRRHPARASVVALGYVSVFLFCGMSWYQWRLGELERKSRTADEANKRLELANADLIRASEDAKYFLLLDRVRELIAKPRPGWRGEALRLLRSAGQTNSVERNLLDLRTLASATLTGFDLTERGTWPFDSVEMLAFFPGGKKFAAVEGRRTMGKAAMVHIVDVESGKATERFTYATEPVKGKDGPVPDGARALAISADGRQLAVGTRSGWIHLWDVEAKGKPISWRTGDSGIDRLIFLPEVKRLLSVSTRGRKLRSWGLDRPGEDSVAVAVNATGLGVDLSAKGDLLACANGEEVQFLDAATLRPVREPWKVATPVFRFHPFGEAAAIVRGDKLVLVDWKAGKVVRRMPEGDVLSAHEGRISELMFTRDGSMLVSCSAAEEDRHVKVWSLATGACLASATIGTTGPLPVAWCNRQACFIAAEERRVRLLGLEGNTVQQFAGVFPRQVDTVRFAPDGEGFATAGAHRALPGVDRFARDDDPPEGFLAIWPGEAGPPSQVTFPPTTDAHAQPWLTFHPSEPALFAGGWTNTAWRVPLGPVSPPVPLGEESHRFVFAKGAARLWSIDKGMTVQSRSAPGAPPGPYYCNGLAILFSTAQFYSLAAGERFVLAGSRNGQLFILNAADARPAKIVTDTRGAAAPEKKVEPAESAGDRSEEPSKSRKGPMTPIRAVALLPGEERGLFASQQGDTCLIELPTGAILDRRRDHSDGIDCLAVSGGGTLLATGGRDNVINLYRVDEKKLSLLLTMEMPRGVMALDFHPGGRKLAAVVRGETAVRILDLERLRDALSKLGLEGDDWGE